MATMDVTRQVRVPLAELGDRVTQPARMPGARDRWERSPRSRVTRCWLFVLQVARAGSAYEMITRVYGSAYGRATFNPLGTRCGVRCDRSRAAGSVSALMYAVS